MSNRHRDRRVVFVIVFSALLLYSFFALPAYSQLQQTSGIEALPSVSGTMAGAIDGKVSVSDEGNAIYNMPLSVPPGTNDMAPKLSLTYDGAAGEGPLGVGWTLDGLSAIARCPAIFPRDGFSDPVDRDGNDRFCVDGQRLMVVSGTYGAAGTQYRTEYDTFSLATAIGRQGDAPLSFQIQSKDHKTYFYGISAASRRLAPGTSDVITWYLEKVVDSSGNYYSVTYSQLYLTGELLPTRIDYTANANTGTLPSKSVQFVWGNGHAPAAERFIAGTAVASGSLLNTVVMTVNGVKAREYRLSYSLADNPSRPFVSQIQECGGNNECLPPTQFTWGTGAGLTPYTRTSTLDDLTPYAGYTSNENQPLITGDWNGDGRTDIGRLGNDTARLYISTGTGFQFFNNVRFQYNRYGQDLIKYPFVLGDWNGDGRVDFAKVEAGGSLVFYASNAASNSYYEYGLVGVLLNKGNPILAADFTGDGRTDIVTISTDRTDNPIGIAIHASTGAGVTGYAYIRDLVWENSSNYVNSPILIGDWNGDGLLDIGRTSSYYQRFYVNQGDGTFTLFASPNWLLSNYGIGNTQQSPAIVTDWNNDGYSDIIRVGAQGLVIFASTGKGFAPPRIINLFGISAGYTNQSTYPLFSGDFNRDGTPDFARIGSHQVDFFAVRNNVLSPYHQLHDFTPLQGYPSDSMYPFVTGDWNGDGFTDFARSSFNSLIFYTRYPYDSLGLTSIKNGFGAEIKIGYSTITDSSVYSREATAAQAPLRVVKSLSFSNGLGSFSNTLYKYVSLRGDETGRGQSTFEQIIATDERTGVTTTTSYRKDAPYKGLASVVEKKLANGTVIFRKTDTLQNVKRSYNSFFVSVSSSVEETYELSGALIDRKTTTYTYDDYGSVTQAVVGHLDGNTETSVSQYRNSPDGTWSLGLLLRTTVTRQTPGQPAGTRVSLFEYNNRNLLIRELLEAENSPKSLVKSYAYDAFGNIISTTTSGPGITSRTEYVTYDSEGTYPVQLTNALGHGERREYDKRHGTVAQITGPNGLTTRSVYDAFGRVTNVYAVDGTEQRTMYLTYSNPELGNARYMVREDRSGGDVRISYHDELGRIIRAETKGFTGARVIVDKVHNERGEETHVSEPYFAGGAAQWTVTEYDAIGRPTVVTAPGQRISRTQYAGLTISLIDPSGKTITRRSDNLGRLVTATDATGNILYTYDAFGNLIKLVDQAGNATILTYDIRGNRVSMQEAAGGSTQFTFDGLGQVLREERADGSVVTYTYDLLGRIVEKTSSDGAETRIYDDGATAKGKLSSVQVNGNGAYRETMTYDFLGRISKVEKFIGDKSYFLTTSYDSLSRVESLKYPSGFRVSYQYNANAYLQQVVGTADGAVLWKAEEVDAAGRTTRERLGNGLVAQNTFDAQTGALTRVKAGTLFDMSFTFDAVGNLLQRRDNVNALNEVFTYDNLYRLTSSKVDNQPAITVSYDTLGNITSKSDVGTFTYGQRGASPHAVTSITGIKGNTYTYDLLGRRIGAQDQTVAFSAIGMPTKITTANTQTMFTYAPSQQKVEQKVFLKDSNGDFTRLSEQKRYFDDLFEEVSVGGQIKNVHYLRAGKSVFAIHTIPQQGIPSTAYLHKDHQGSIQAISDAAGAIIERLSFDAWGLKRNSDWSAATVPLYSSVDRTYTGHEYLDESSLIHMSGRAYDPVIGRFISPDPFIQAPDDSQSLNRYSYVLNNPLSYTDPSGFFFKKLFKTIFKAAVAFAVSFVLSPPAGASIGSIFFSGALSGVVISTVNTVISGGSLADGFKAGLKGALLSGTSALFTKVIGDGFADADSWGTRIFKEYSGEAKAIAHGVSQGAFSKAQGGSFLRGFAAGGGGSYFGGGSGMSGAVRSALIGGTASALAGGKFEDGAMQAAFVHVFNDLMHPQENASAQNHPAMASIDPGGINPHYYMITDLICRSNAAGCNMSDAIAAFPRFAVPAFFVSEPVQNGDINNVFGFPFKASVTSYVSNGGLTITNVTNLNHIFFAGLIERNLFESNGNIYVQTIGVGNGPFRKINKVVGENVFRGLNNRYRNYLLNK